MQPENRMWLPGRVQEKEMKAPIGWSKVTDHLVWDVKMDFTSTARWVLDGHKTLNPIGSTYSRTPH